MKKTKSIKIPSKAQDGRTLQAWQSIEKVWEQNRGVDESRLQKDIQKAISEVRSGLPRR
jgi:hypothetical protein